MRRATAAPAGRPLTTLRGRIATVFFASPEFSAGCIETAAGDQEPFAGKLYARAGDAVILHGTWGSHPKYGRQFHAERIEYDTHLSVEGLAQYLANHPDMKGIGPVRAERIAREFGDRFEEVLRDDPEAIAAAAKVPLAVVEGLREEWERNALVNATFTSLSAFGLTHHQVRTLVGKFGNSVIAVLQENPFLLVREIAGLGFKRVDEIARKIGTDKEHPERLRAGVLHCVAEALDRGDCWVEYGDLVEAARSVLRRGQEVHRDEREVLLRAFGELLVVMYPECDQALAVDAVEMLRCLPDLAVRIAGEPAGGDQQPDVGVFVEDTPS